MDFDSHAAIKHLSSAGLTEPQAEALIDALRGLAQSGRSDLATTADLKTEIAALRAATSADLHNAIAQLKIWLIKWMVGIGCTLAVLLFAVIALLLN